MGSALVIQSMPYPNSVALLPSLFQNAPSFPAPLVGAAAGIQPSLLANSSSFPAPVVGRGTVNLQPGLKASEVSFDAPTVVGAVTDPNYTSRVLILNPTGAQNSTSFTDNSPSAHTFTVNGSAKVDNTGVFTLGALLCNTIGTDWIETADSNDWNFAAGAFGLEIFWEALNNPGSNNHYIMGQGSAGGFAWDIMAVESARQKWFNRDSFSLVEASAFGSWAANTAYYLAVDRDGSNVVRQYRGTTTAAGGGSAAMITKVTGAGTLTNATDPWRIGLGWSGAGSNCRIGGVRITKGLSLFASDSGGTIPALPFPTS